MADRPVAEAVADLRLSNAKFGQDVARARSTLLNAVRQLERDAQIAVGLQLDFRQVRSQLTREFGRIEADGGIVIPVRIDTRDALDELIAFESIAKDQNVDVPVTVDTDQALGDLAALEQLASQVDAIVAPVSLDTNPAFGAIPPFVDEAADQLGEGFYGGGQQSGEQFASGFEQAGRSFLTTVSLTLGGFFSLSLVRGFQRLTTIEDALASLTVALGDTAQAAGVLDDVVEVVTGTPFNLDQFAKAASSLISFGVEAEKVPGFLTAIGEAAASQGSRANEFAQRLSTTFGRISAANRITNLEVQQFTAVGVNALQILGNAFEVTASEARDMIANGVIPAQEALQILSDGIMDGSTGIAGTTTAFAGTMESLRETLTGAIGGFKAATARFGANIIDPLQETLTVGFNAASAAIDSFSRTFRDTLDGLAESDGIARFQDLLRTLPDQVNRLIGALQEFGPALAPLAGAFGAAGLGQIKNLLGPLGAIIPPLGVFTTAVAALVATSPELRSELLPILLDVGEVLVQVGAVVGVAAGEILESLIPALVEITRAAAGLVPFVAAAGDLVSILAVGLVPILTTLSDAITQFPTPVLTAIVAAFIGFKIVDTISGPLEKFTNTLSAFPDATAKVQSESSRTIRAFDRIGVSAKGVETAVKVAGVAVATGLAGMAVASEDTATQITGLLGAATGIATGFAVGGPIGGGLAAGAAAVGFLGGQMANARREAAEFEREMQGLADRVIDEFLELGDGLLFDELERIANLGVELPDTFFDTEAARAGILADLEAENIEIPTFFDIDTDDIRQQILDDIGPDGIEIPGFFRTDAVRQQILDLIDDDLRERLSGFGIDGADLVSLFDDGSRSVREALAEFNEIFESTPDLVGVEEYRDLYLELIEQLSQELGLGLDIDVDDTDQYIITVNTLLDLLDDVIEIEDVANEKIAAGAARRRDERKLEQDDLVRGLDLTRTSLLQQVQVWEQVGSSAEDFIISTVIGMNGAQNEADLLAEILGLEVAPNIEEAIALLDEIPDSLDDIGDGIEDVSAESDEWAEAVGRVKTAFDDVLTALGLLNAEMNIANIGEDFERRAGREVRIPIDGVDDDGLDSATREAERAAEQLQRRGEQIARQMERVEQLTQTLDERRAQAAERTLMTEAALEQAIADGALEGAEGLRRDLEQINEPVEQAEQRLQEGLDRLAELQAPPEERDGPQSRAGRRAADTVSIAFFDQLEQAAIEQDKTLAEFLLGPGLLAAEGRGDLIEPFLNTVIASVNTALADGDVAGAIEFAERGREALLDTFTAAFGEEGAEQILSQLFDVNPAVLTALTENFQNTLAGKLAEMDPIQVRTDADYEEFFAATEAARAEAAANIAVPVGADLDVFDRETAISRELASSGITVPIDADLSEMDAALEEFASNPVVIQVTGVVNDLVNDVRGVVSGLGFKDGGIVGGGDGSHVAQIAPAGAWRVWAEPETGGEAYIPLAPSKRGRSKEILSEVADMFGFQLTSKLMDFDRAVRSPSVSFSMPSMGGGSSADMEGAVERGLSKASAALRLALAENYDRSVHVETLNVNGAQSPRRTSRRIVTDLADLAMRGF